MTIKSKSTLEKFKQETKYYDYMLVIADNKLQNIETKYISFMD